MEPMQYLDIPKRSSENPLSKRELRHYARIITDRHEERMMVCLLKENRDNPFRKKFKKIFFISTGLLMGAFLLLICMLVLQIDIGEPSWYSYVGFGAIIAACMFSYVCRVILRKYVTSVIEKYLHTMKPPVSDTL